MREFLMFFTDEAGIVILVMAMPEKGAQWHRDIIPALKRVARCYGAKSWQVDGLDVPIVSRDRWEYDITSRNFVQTACRILSRRSYSVKVRR